MHAGRLFISTEGVLDHLCTRCLGHFLPIELKPNGGVHRTLPAQAGRRRGEDAQRMGVCIGEARLETSVTAVVDEVRSVCILSNHCAFGVAEDHCEGIHLLLPVKTVERRNGIADLELLVAQCIHSHLRVVLSPLSNSEFPVR